MKVTPPMKISKVVYSVTVIDLRSNLPLGIRRTPVICTDINYALYAVKNNLRDLADRKSTRLNSSHMSESRMPSSA